MQGDLYVWRDVLGMFLLHFGQSCSIPCFVSWAQLKSSLSLCCAAIPRHRKCTVHEDSVPVLDFQVIECVRNILMNNPKSCKPYPFPQTQPYRPIFSRCSKNEALRKHLIQRGYIIILDIGFSLDGANTSRRTSQGHQTQNILQNSAAMVKWPVTFCDDE
jgi:hypothetical protein